MLVPCRCCVSDFDPDFWDHGANGEWCPRSFYGINLNQSVVLQQIHFDGKGHDPWHRLFKIATGNLIITALGFVPGNLFFVCFVVPWAKAADEWCHSGYWASTVLVEYIGRKPIQIGGFLLEALFCEQYLYTARYTSLTCTAVAILAGKFHTLSTASFIACFTLLQVSLRLHISVTQY